MSENIENDRVYFFVDYVFDKADFQGIGQYLFSLCVLIK